MAIHFHPCTLDLSNACAMHIHPCAIFDHQRPTLPPSKTHPSTIHIHVSANSLYRYSIFRRTCAKMAAKSPKNINIKMSAMTTLYFPLGSTWPPSSSSLFAPAFSLCVVRRLWIAGSGPVAHRMVHEQLSRPSRCGRKSKTDSW